jgi:hypothetical protein
MLIPVPLTMITIIVSHCLFDAFIHSIAEGTLARQSSVIRNPAAIDNWDNASKTTLKIRLIGAKKLVAVDSNGWSNPYVRMEVGNQRQQSSVVPKVLHIYLS